MTTKKSTKPKNVIPTEGMDSDMPDWLNDTEKVTTPGTSQGTNDGSYEDYIEHVIRSDRGQFNLKLSKPIQVAILAAMAEDNDGRIDPEDSISRFVHELVKEWCEEYSNDALTVAIERFSRKKKTKSKLKR